MKTCKDCIHVDVCMDVAAHYKQVFFDDEYCEQFKDRLKFIKSPFAIGDIVYYIDNMDIEGADLRICKQVIEQIIYSSLSGFTFVGNNHIFYQKDIDKRVFTTMEKAENVLKRCENEWY